MSSALLPQTEAACRAIGWVWKPAIAKELPRCTQTEEAIALVPPTASTSLFAAALLLGGLYLAFRLLDKTI